MSEAQETYDEGELAGDLMRAVGKQVKLLRERAGLTQKELGDRLGYSVGSRLLPGTGEAYASAGVPGSGG